jgi:Protein of unknown function (DUF1523)
MWRYIKWGFRITLLLMVVGFFHYTLPQHDIVRITNTYNKQTVIGSNWLFYSSGDSGANTTTTADTIRDIRYIDAVFPDGDSVMVYRNEDTGWIWPPYFKYDSSTLQAEATNLKSDKTAPEWVSVTHYGWRLPIFSIFPNAVAVNPVAGPDVSITPWVNIVVLTLLAFGLFMLRRMWMQFRERTIDPVVASAGETWDQVDATADAARDRAKGVFGRFTAWLGTWSGKGR